MKAILLGLLLLALHAQAGAQTVLLARYTFDGGSKTATDVDPRLGASSLTPERTGIVNTSASAGNLYYLLNPSTPPALAQTRAEALASDALVSWTLTPGAGESIDLGSLAFEIGGQSAQFRFQAYAVLEVETGSDTFVYDATFGDPSAPQVSHEVLNGSSATVMTGAGRFTLGGLPSLEEAATFRLYVYYDHLERMSGTPGPMPTGTNYSIRLENLEIYAIPEPSSVVLLGSFGGVVLFGLAFRRRGGMASRVA